MNEAAISARLGDLLTIMTALPFAGSVAGQNASQGVYAPEGRGDVESIESALEQLRLQMKYLVFDLEATRRENRYLRQMLEARHNSDPDDRKEDEGTLL
jgi:hypothetical protein